MMHSVFDQDEEELRVQILANLEDLER